MTETFTPTPQPAFFDEETYRLVRGVRTRRILAYVIDVVILAILTVFATIAVAFLGLVTLGIGWLLYTILVPGLALCYMAFSLGGPRSATPGMQAMNLEMRMMDGSRPSPLIAAAHGILFYIGVASGMLIIASLVCSLLNTRKRMLHDLILGTVIVNAAELRQFGY